MTELSSLFFNFRCNKKNDLDNYLINYLNIFLAYTH